MRVALIFGITGQTGSYLAELLLDKGYSVHGIIRRSATFNTGRIEHIFHRLSLHYGDVLDLASLLCVLKDVKPDEIYNLAAQSHVAVSFKLPTYSSQVDAIGPLNIMEAIRITGIETKFYQASTSEMYGGDEHDYPSKVWKSIVKNGMNETTPFHPKSPYGAAKLFAHNMVGIYRASYGLNACCGILFNHESERRDPRFVTRKITRAAAHIKLGTLNQLVLGNLDAKRDWGHARDYAQAIWTMVQKEKLQDYVIATGETHTVRDVVEWAFEYVGMPITWSGTGLDEKGMWGDCELVMVSREYHRPCEVHYLKGDRSKAEKDLAWTPKISVKEMIQNMVEHDLCEARRRL